MQGLGGRDWENILHKLDMRHKDFFESGVKNEEDTLSKGVAEKDTNSIWSRVCGKSREVTKENINNRRHGVWMG